MEKSPYEIGTDEAAAKLGLSPRSVRRLGEKGILTGRVEITSVGKQWFFKTESVESLIRAREEKLKREERNRIAKGTIGHVPGHPRTSEDIPGHDRSRPMSDEKRVEFLEKLLEQERGEHAKTKEKLEQKETLLLQKAEAAARLEGEKIGYERYASRLEQQQRQLMTLFRDTVLKLESKSTSDIPSATVGHETKDNPGRVRTSPVVTEGATENVPEPEAGESELYTPSQSPQNDARDDFSSDPQPEPSSEF